MSPDDRVRVGHIIEMFDAATRFIKGKQRSDLDSDQMLLFALVRAVEISGEAASKISAEGRNELAGLPWSLMIGMRNRLVHGYVDIDRDILWNTVTQAMPPVAERLRVFLRE
jgi:uncharacterized protein with HEPN domain